jgi:ribokinase
MVSEDATIVVAGAINTDLVAVVDHAPQAGETVTGQSFHIYGGGKGANQAVAARRAGARVVLVGAVGDDAFGADRRGELERDGIELGSVRVVGGMASGVALITVEREGENRIAYVPGPTLKIDGDLICEAIERARPAVYLQPNEVTVDAAASAFERAKARGAVTILNAAPDPERTAELLDKVDYLIVNEVEAAALLGRKGAFADVTETLARETGTIVVLTAGADGAYGYQNGSPLHVPAPVVKVVDTTGAGDTFCGAFATRIARGEAFGDAVRWAVAAAALAATKAGAQPAIPTADDVDAFMVSNG